MYLGICGNAAFAHCKNKHQSNQISKKFKSKKSRHTHTIAKRRSREKKYHATRTRNALKYQTKTLTRENEHMYQFGSSQKQLQQHVQQQSKHITNRNININRVHICGKSNKHLSRHQRLKQLKSITPSLSLKYCQMISRLIKQCKNKATRNAFFDKLKKLHPKSTSTLECIEEWYLSKHLQDKNCKDNDNKSQYNPTNHIQWYFNMYRERRWWYNYSYYQERNVDLKSKLKPKASKYQTLFSLDVGLMDQISDCQSIYNWEDCYSISIVCQLMHQCNSSAVRKLLLKEIGILEKDHYWFVRDDNVNHFGDINDIDHIKSKDIGDNDVDRKNEDKFVHVEQDQDLKELKIEHQDRKREINSLKVDFQLLLVHQLQLQQQSKYDEIAVQRVDCKVFEKKWKSVLEQQNIINDNSDGSINVNTNNYNNYNQSQDRKERTNASTSWNCMITTDTQEIGNMSYYDRNGITMIKKFDKDTFVKNELKQYCYCVGNGSVNGTINSGNGYGMRNYNRMLNDMRFGTRIDTYPGVHRELFLKQRQCVEFMCLLCLKTWYYLTCTCPNYPNAVINTTKFIINTNNNCDNIDECVWSVFNLLSELKINNQYIPYDIMSIMIGYIGFDNFETIKIEAIFDEKIDRERVTTMIAKSKCKTDIDINKSNQIRMDDKTSIGACKYRWNGKNGMCVSSLPVKWNSDCYNRYDHSVYVN